MKRVWTILLACLVALAVSGAGAATTTTTYTITDLGSLGYGVSDGLAINSNGQVTGYSYTGATVPTSGCCGNCYTNQRNRVWPTSTTRSSTATAR